MASLHEYLGQKYNHNDHWTFSGRNTVCITETYAHRGDDATTHTCQSHELNQRELKYRLEVQSDVGREQAQVTNPSLQIVWIHRLVQARKFDVSEEIFAYLHDHLGHDLARNAGFTALAGVSTVSNKSASLTTGFVNFLPKFSMTWAINTQYSRQTIICLVEEPKRRVLEDLFRQAFIQRLCDNPALSTLITSILFSMEIDDVQERVKQDVRQVEVRTGHHDWKSRGEAPALGDMIGLAARMSGCSTRIESSLRKQRARTDFVRRIMEQCSLISQNSTSSALVKQIEEVQAITKVLDDWARAQLIDTEFVKARVQVQLDAVSSALTVPLNVVNLFRLTFI